MMPRLYAVTDLPANDETVEEVTARYLSREVRDGDLGPILARLRYAVWEVETLRASRLLLDARHAEEVGDLRADLAAAEDALCRVRAELEALRAGHRASP